MGTILRKILPPFLILSLALGLISCVPGEVQITEEELVERVATAAENIKTCQFDMNVKIDMSGKSKDKTMEMSMLLNNTSIIDNVNKKRLMKTVMMMPEKGKAPQSVETEAYFVNNVMYMKMNLPGMPEQWVKQKMPQDFWERQNQIKQLVELLKASQIEILGSERINNTDCWVIKVTPDLKKLWQTAMQQWGLIKPLVKDENLDLEKIVKNVAQKQWVAKDTYFTIKTQTQMSLIMSSENLNLPSEEEFEINIDESIDLTFHNYNEPVSIELPPEAEKATELPKTK